MTIFDELAVAKRNWPPTGSQRLRIKLLDAVFSPCIAGSIAFFKLRSPENFADSYAETAPLHLLERLLVNDVSRRP
ncbi:hypothetical protein TRIUR3_20653 [Triticum urartu]|uniref:Uncharacterized protein n=1 Tax=Triticum urartu TaxID=4572 RepID=M7ZMR7_TRIUA|nr:hypothetical protein TRIUR3_20653 [Triticum urartu]